MQHVSTFLFQKIYIKHFIFQNKWERLRTCSVCEATREATLIYLLLIIARCFTCCENKIWYSIKKSKNIMSMIVFNFFFWFLCLYRQFQLFQQQYFGWNFFIILKNVLDRTWKSFNTELDLSKRIGKIII